MMFSGDDTIVAIATPIGEGGLGVVRLSGPLAIEITDQLFQFESRLLKAPTHTLHHGWIHNQTEIIDEAVASVFRAPHSYTGENVAEISCHGSPILLKTIVELCVEHGARLARPGEFTQRAYMSGKIDLAQAEAVANLIQAKSDKARSAAANQLRGALSERLKKIRIPLVDLLAHVEANLDFVEEDIPPVAKEEIVVGLSALDKEMSELLAGAATGRWLRDGVRVALAGKPNVGKSSLFNALLTHDRAIVTDVPGTTRDTLEEQLQWDGVPFVLIDTAGLRATDDPVESSGAARAALAHKNADIVLVVFDASEPFSPEDKKILDSLHGRRAVIALNKSDKGLRVKTTDFSVQFPTVGTSARDGSGLNELKKTLLACVSAGSGEPEPLLVTQERHAEQIEKARKRVRAALSAAQTGNQTENIALDMRQALEELGAITGENASEDVLDSIFRRFCIGK